ncbi:MAG: hypothetical protein V4487_01115 [Chlamydiota bacterium]
MKLTMGQSIMKFLFPLVTPPDSSSHEVYLSEPARKIDLSQYHKIQFCTRLYKESGDAPRVCQRAAAAFDQAIREGDKIKVREMIAENKNLVNHEFDLLDEGVTLTENYRIPLRTAILFQQREIAHILIDNGADVTLNKVREFAATESPFYFAVRAQEIDLVKKMLQKGAPSELVWPHPVTGVQISLQETSLKEISKAMVESKIKSKL